MTTKISQPTVETVTAELFVVKIGNKQMTVSVYNQLYIEDCWDNDWNIIYPVWGKTNRDGEYVLFQKGNDLRKCKVPKYWGNLSYNSELCDFIVGNKQRIKEIFPKDYYNYRKFDYVVEDTRPRPYKLLERIMDEYDPFMRMSEQDIKEAFSVLSDALLNEFKELFNKKNTINIRHEKMVNELKLSRQLFIAV